MPLIRKGVCIGNGLVLGSLPQSEGTVIQGSVMQFLLGAVFGLSFAYVIRWFIDRLVDGGLA